MRNFKINNIKPVQEDFWGNGAIYHGYAGMPDSDGRVYTEEQCEIEAKRIADMRVKVVRTFYKWWAWNSETNTWDWDNATMTAFYKWLGRMKKIGVTVAINTGWWCPRDVAEPSSPFYVPDNWQASVDNYANWVSETVYQLIEKRGFTNIKILVMFTEPQHAGPGDPNGNPMPGLNAYTCWYQATKAAHEALVRDGRRELVKLMGPNEGATDTSDMLKWVAQQDCDFIDIFSSHNYVYANPVPFNIFDKNKNGINLSRAGGRVSREVSLIQGAEYKFNATIKFINKQDEITGNILLGVFEDIGNNDIYSNETDKPVGECEKGTVVTLNAKEIVNKDIDISFNFTASNNKKANVGAFYDVKTDGLAALTKLEILDADGNRIYDNSDFSEYKEGWQIRFCSDYLVATDCWHRSAKTGLKYVPEGKPYCFDEYNYLYNRNHKRLSHGSEAVSAAVTLMNTGVTYSLLWTIFDQQWPNSHTTNEDAFVDGDHRCGTMPVLTRSLVPYHSFYAFTLLSRYVDGGGTKVYEGIGGYRISLTLSVSKDGDITVVVVNDKEVADEFNISFEKSLGGITLNRHYFDPYTLVPDERAEIIGIDKVLENVTDSITDKIAPHGVIVYTTHND